VSLSVFIDGGHGTTGLEIRDRLAARPEIGLIELGEIDRKKENARRDALCSADIAILCLPDDAAREAVAMVRTARTRIIDASTAHRTSPGWIYGFPELGGDQPGAIAEARFVANPGCYPTGFLALIAPLTAGGLLPNNAAIAVYAISGYSGGGRAMIEEFESGGAKTANRAYGLSLDHKHLAEMQRYAGLASPPVFAPHVVNAYRGMIVEIGLSLGQFASGVSPDDIRSCLEARYRNTLISVLPASQSDAMDTIALEYRAGSDGLDIALYCNAQGSQIRLVAMLDNLGKGAAGAAVQNLNLMAGFEPTTGLTL